jgi:hypothetical protein
MMAMNEGSTHSKCVRFLVTPPLASRHEAQIDHLRAWPSGHGGFIQRHSPIPRILQKTHVELIHPRQGKCRTL